MSAKHTPEPWYVRPRNGPGSITAEVCYGFADECVADGVYEMADARLIAAAPDLLEIVARCEMWLSTAPEGRAMQLACQAAIAKATGKEIT